MTKRKQVVEHRILKPVKGWFCAVTNPNCQRRAELELHSLGFRTFWPKVRRWATHSRVRKASERPLLGRYMFVEVDYPEQSFATIKAVNGIETLVSNLGFPTHIPSHWVEGLLRRYLEGEWDEIAKGPLPLGARIRVVEGEFDDMLATVTKVSGHQIGFKLLGTNIHSKMHECSVRAA